MSAYLVSWGSKCQLMATTLLRKVTEPAVLQKFEKQLDKIEMASVHKTAFMTLSSDTWQNVRMSPFPKAP